MAPFVTKPPTSFWVVSVLLLIWNAIGCAAYLSAAYGEEVAVTPVWMTAAYGLAVWAGVLGPILMLMRKRQARIAFLISFIAALVQFVGGIFVTDLLSGTAQLVIPAMVILILIFSLGYTRRAATRGWLM
ncbi:MAG: hypothetical protein WA906_07035 [Pacificimonas sp.]